VNELHSVGVEIYLHQQAIDTSTPAGKLAFSVFGALAEYERELIRERVRTGLDRARRNGTRLGRPTNLTDEVRTAIYEWRRDRRSIQDIARRFKVGTGTVYRVLAS
jgi:DNA invertase Pin-like site-specific DNA recombinase